MTLDPALWAPLAFEARASTVRVSSRSAVMRQKRAKGLAIGRVEVGVQRRNGVDWLRHNVAPPATLQTSSV
jgi:arabinogalactan endo-1,4-beta-galactosidase